MIELRQAPVRDALAGASRVLSELGEALAASGEVVVLAGNHDHHLVEAWLRRRAAAASPEPLGLEAAVDWHGGEPLAAVVERLESGGAQVRVAYPGVWLRDDVWATHGHYLDRHTTVPLFERLGVGAVARIMRRPLEQVRSAEDYEAVLGPVYALIHELAQSAVGGTPSAGASAQAWQALGRGLPGGTLGQRALALGASAAVAVLNRGGIGPVRTDLSAAELRRAGLLAFAAVLRALDVPCRYAIFGHTHRAGPLPGDDRDEWFCADGGEPRPGGGESPGHRLLINSGSWVHEPIFLGPYPQSSPYRAGFAVWVDDDERPPQLVNLLDGPQQQPPAPGRV